MNTPDLSGDKQDVLVNHNVDLQLMQQQSNHQMTPVEPMQHVQTAPPPPIDSTPVEAPSNTPNVIRRSTREVKKFKPFTVKMTGKYHE